MSTGYNQTARSCQGCGSCYLDQMDFICGHKDAGTFGKLVRVASTEGGHCGPSLPKWTPHPLRNENGSFK